MLGCQLIQDKEKKKRNEKRKEKKREEDRNLERDWRDNIEDFNILSFIKFVK